eukprot:5420778-Amphidinium_carterae.1
MECTVRVFPDRIFLFLPVFRSRRHTRVPDSGYFPLRRTIFIQMTCCALGGGRSKLQAHFDFAASRSAARSAIMTSMRQLQDSAYEYL